MSKRLKDAWNIDVTNHEIAQTWLNFDVGSVASKTDRNENLYSG